MKAFLRKMSIEHFRGACQPVTLQFEANKKITLISGNNGTGKSTICDAFEVIGCSNIGSIEDKKFGGSGINKKSYLPSLDKEAPDVKIELETITGSWTATLGKREIMVAPSTENLDIRVLRRSNILRMVEAKGIDRYAVMRAFLDLSKIESVEKSVKDASKNLSQRANQAAERITLGESQLEQLWNDNASPGSSAIEWAKQLKEPTYEELPNIRAAFDKVKTVLTGMSALWTELVQKEEAFTLAEAKVLKEEEKYKEVLSLQTDEQGDVIECLESVQAYLQQESASDCPICKTTFEPGVLITSIQSRLSSLKNVQTAATGKKQATARFKSAKSLLDDIRSRIKDVPASIEAALHDLVIMEDHEAKTILNEIKLFKNKLGTATEEKPESLITEIESGLELRDKRSATEEALSKTVKQAKRILKSCLEIHDEAKMLAVAAERAAKVSKVIETQRKQFVDEVLLEISGEVNRLYTLLHPDEKVGGIKLAIKSRGQGSVEMTGEFHGKIDIPPEAFFSDSHLDTLGICIFLALAKRGGASETVLVFDDVVSSIDSEHLSRLVQLIADESKEFGHVIIATHMELLEHHFRHNPDTRDRTQFDRIAEWSVKNGFRIAAREFQVDLLRAMVRNSPLDKISTGGKAGHLLEVLLHQLALSFRVPMPLKSPPKYVLSEYLQSFTRDWREKRVKIDIPGAAGTVATPLAAFLDPIERTTWVRNIVDHGNIELNLMLPESDVRDFANLVLKLHDEFCENIPRWKRTAC